MMILIVLAAVLGGLAFGAGVVVYFSRDAAARSAADSAAAQAAAIDAAVRSTLIERKATAETMQLDRAATVDAAVRRAAEVADQKLDARMRQGTERLDAGSQSFERRVGDINKELTKMSALVTALQKDRAQQHGEVVESLENAAKVTTALQSTTGSLREALASPKARGQWGERMAEDVLRAAGFVEGINYEQQTTSDGGIPDFTFPLPKNRVLHMDVKFPIDNYLRFLEADTDVDAADRFRKVFRKDVREKIKELADRGYSDPEDSLDYVLLFIPNESVFGFINDDDPELIDVAMKRKVVLCSPTTLFANLATIRKAMDSFMLERKGDEILECLAGFRQEWGKFSDHVDKVGNQLSTLNNGFEQLSGTRRNVMERQLRKVDELDAQREVGADPDADWPPLREVEAG
jgi:DNA recombination protein RmuC